MRRALAFLVYPLITFGSVWAAAALGEAGWSEAVVVTLITGLSTGLVIGLERVMPWCGRWLEGHGDFWTDGAHTVAWMIAMPEVIKVALAGALAAASGSIAARVGLVGLWPSGRPWWVQVPLALVVVELFQYWLHRLMHEVPLLWRLHSVHHSAPRLYWLNAGRFHPLDALLTHLLSVPILWLLGCPAQTVALFIVFATAHGAFQHSNIDTRLGPLNWIFSQGELHRWHHSPVQAESDHNYGAWLIVWDIVFGTRMLPGDRRPPTEVGVEGMPDFPKGFWGQIMVPFRWPRKPNRP